VSDYDGKWAFIDNPVAGSGFAGRYLPEVRAEIKRYHPGADIFSTERPGHATELAAGLIEQGYTHIVAVGGDGTINEIVQSLIGHPEVTFGVVSAGSGNDFVHVLGFPERFAEKDWVSLFQAKSVRLDAGKCNGRYFINTLGVGFDAQVAADFHKMKIRNGKLRYWIALIKNLIGYKPKRLKLVSEEFSEDRAMFMISVGNGRSSGGGFAVLPNALADDGLLDACVFRFNNDGLIRKTKKLMEVIRGTHNQDPTVTPFRTKKLVIESSEDMPMHIDGELFVNSRFEIEIIPAAVNVIVNPGHPNYLKVV